MIPGPTQSRRSTADENGLYERQAALATLLDAYTATRQSTALGVVTVAGEAGLGKTRLLLEFEHALRQHSADQQHDAPRIAYGRALAASSVGNGFQPLREALTDLVTEEQHAGEHRLKRLLGSLGTVAPEWLGAIPVVGGVMKAAAVTVNEIARRHPEGMAPSMNAQLGLFVEQLAADRPLVLLLDDLHWADDSSVDAIFFLTQTLGRHPVLLVLAYRPADLHGRDRPHPLRQTLLRIQRYCPVTQIALTRLGNDAIAALLRSRLGFEPWPELVGWLRRRSGGNPLFVHEYISHLHDRRHQGRLTMERVQELVTSMADIPARLDAVLAERLEALTDDELRVLQVAATIGPTFTLRDLSELSDLDQPSTRQALRTLTQRAGIVTPAQEGSAYTFFHNLVREHVLGRLRDDDPIDYQELHRLRADQLARRAHADRGLATLEQLAYHYHEAADHEQAVTVCLDAGQASRAIGAVSEAARYLSWAVHHADAIGQPQHQVDARCQLATTQQELIRTGEALAVLEEAVGIAGAAQLAPDLTLSLRLELARAYRMEERWEQAHAALASAAELAEEHGDDECRAAIALTAGELALSGSPRDLAVARSRFEDAARLTGDPWRRASAYAHIGFVALATEDVATATDRFDTALEEALTSQRSGRIYEAHLWRAKLALATLRLDDAQQALDEMIRLSQRHGVATTVAHHHRDTGRRAALAGDLPSAVASYTAYLDRMLATADPVHGIRAATYLYLQVEELIAERDNLSAALFAERLADQLDQQVEGIPAARSLIRQLRTLADAARAGDGRLDALRRAGQDAFWSTTTARATVLIFNFHIDDLHAFRRRFGYRVP